MLGTGLVVVLLRPLVLALFRPAGPKPGQLAFRRGQHLPPAQVLRLPASNNISTTDSKHGEDQNFSVDTVAACLEVAVLRICAVPAGGAGLAGRGRRRLRIRRQCGAVGHLWAVVESDGVWGTVQRSRYLTLFFLGETR